MPGVSALEGLRVVELGGEIAAAYATKLLCELGAEVVKVEPAAGDPLRAWDPLATGNDDGLLFRYLNGGKQSVVGEPGDVAAIGADVVVESLGAGELERHGVDVGALAPAVVRIADFGQRGPYVGLPTTRFTVQAMSGWVSPHGVPGIDPVQVGARIAEYTAGTFAACAALTALRAAPAVVDLSAMECLVGTLAYPNLVMEDMLGAGLPLPTARHFPLPGIVRCRDGWVGINALTGQHFVDACSLLEVEEYAPRQQELADGGPLLDEFFTRIEPWLMARDAQEIVELSQAFRVPAAPVGDGRMMLEFAQLRERPFFVDEDGLTLPGPPYRLGATPAERRGPAPALGSTELERVGVGNRPARAPERTGLPFDGVRVVDLGTFWAGPYCTMYLGAFGADVIKVESTVRPDGFRFSGSNPAMGDDWYERSGIFAGTNLNKRGITLDLSTGDGRALLWRLIDRADVVLENFSARVVEQFGIGYDEIRGRKPDVIMVRMPGFGLVGPWRDYVGWAMVIEQATGMASVTGPPDRPMHPGGPADPIIGMHAAVAVQAALRHRERTGEGQLIEVAQLETGANLTAELMLEASAHERSLPRDGNRDPHVAPQGAYPCAAGPVGPEWVALTVAGDAEWRALNGLVGRDEWAGYDLADRRAHHDEIDRAIADWTRERSASDTAEVLRVAGITAAPTLLVPRMFDDPQLVDRGYYVELDHQRTGRRRYPGWPMQFSFTQQQHRSGAPTLGEDNDDVLRNELGLDDAEIERLRDAGVIGDTMSM